MNELIQLYLNLIIAIIFGLSIDKFFSKLNINNKLIRIFAQFTVNILIINTINHLYSNYNLSDIDSGIFAMSIFLATQQTVIKDIQSLGTYIT
jgi:hypothetical protein